MDIRLMTLRNGFDFQTCWVVPCAAISDDRSLALLTMTRLDINGSDVFDGSYGMTSRDGGATWSEPEKWSAFGRRPNEYGGTSCLSGFPFWHQASKTMLAFPDIINYTPDNVVDLKHPRCMAFTRRDAATGLWSEPSLLEVREKMRRDYVLSGRRMEECDNGDILLPLSAMSLPGFIGVTHIARVRIDGTKARIVEYGSPLDQVRQPRGLYEPTIIRFDGRYFLNMRNDITGYVASSRDGLHFDNPRPWCFDNGELLGNYNTMMQWVRHGDRELYLVYTRRNADNDHVFRNRAPLFIARVDTDTLRVIRDTEQVVAPNRGARLGNFHTCQLDDNRAWVTVAEWMQNDNKGHGRVGSEYCASFGSDNSVYLADITW